MKKPLEVSFVVPVYNTLDYAVECLESIRKQQGELSYEVIIVDDCSTDGVSELVSQYAQKQNWQYIRHSTNQGAAKTITEGLDLARGKYIARIDSDDRYAGDFLLKTIPILESNQNCAFVFGNIRMIGSNGSFLSDQRNPNLPDQPGIQETIYYQLLADNFVSAPTVIAKAFEWKKALPIPDHMNFNDWYLMLTMAKNNACYYLNEILADYRLHDNNMHNTMILDGTGEKIYFEVLDMFLKDDKNIKLKNRIYAGWYEKLGNSYFGNQMHSQARDVYLKALTNDTSKIFNSPIVRRILATMIPNTMYRSAKKILADLKLLLMAVIP